jgi:threonylcarbamoyladenosine tRNA methylthiotransferase MtaB
MSKPLMSKATAVWLVDNTTLSFIQIADFCGMHELEVQGIADGDVAIGVKGFDPVSNNQLDGIEIDDLLFELITGETRVMPHVHLSLQSGSDMILKRMKRRHTRADALRLVADVRAVRPDVAFGADLIAGFPTETEAMFRNTLDLVEAAGLAFLHVFPYSPRPGTPAARMPPVPKAEVRERAARLRAAGEAALARHLASRVGGEVQGLVERPGLARAEDFSEIAFSGSTPAGEIQTFRVTGQDGRRLLAEPHPRIAGGQALDTLHD